MSTKTIIAWTDKTFNIAWGCSKVSQGCKQCYAATLSVRYGFKNLWGLKEDRRTFGGKYWAGPIKWNKEAEKAGTKYKVFSSSMCDIFEDHEIIKKELKKLWSLIKVTPNLEWQLLTKRADRIGVSLPDDWGIGYKNVWLGVSVEDSENTWRIDFLRTIPAKIKFVSYEPALGQLTDVDLSNINWVIYGGESGNNYREHDVQWARYIKSICEEKGIAFFYKQSSAIRTEMGIELDGKVIRKFPEYEKHGEEVIK